MSAQLMSPNEEALWDAIHSLEKQLQGAIDGWRNSVEQTKHALDNTDRSIAQTKEVIAMLKQCPPQHETSQPKEKS